MLAVLLVLLAQVPCEPFETSVVCSCRQAIGSGCEALRQINPELANRLEAAAQAAAALEASRSRANHPLLRPSLPSASGRSTMSSPGLSPRRWKSMKR